MTRSIKRCILYSVRAALEIGNLVLLRTTRGKVAINQRQETRASLEFAPS